MKIWAVAIVASIGLVAISYDGQLTSYSENSINQARVESDASVLRKDPFLQEYAQNYSDEMASTEIFEHSDNLSDLLSGRSWLGENIGVCRGCSELPANRLIDQFADSPSHAANLFAPQANSYGEGIATGAGGTYVTQIFGTDTVNTGSLERLYKAVFLRGADLVGLNYWRNQLLTDTSMIKIANTFAASPEFMSRYGSLDNSNFVKQIYRNVLDREIDEAGSIYWNSQLADGLSRGEFVLHFSESDEFKEKEG